MTSALTKLKIADLQSQVMTTATSGYLQTVKNTIQPNQNGLVGVKGVLVIEDQMTGDERFIDQGAIYWENGPWSLMSQLINDGHKGAPLVGRIDALERVGNNINFSGVIDTNIADGAETVRLIANQLLRGISLDPDNFEPELRTQDGIPLDSLSEEQLGQIDPDKVYMAVTSMRVRGGTMLPMPAFVDTELELFSVDNSVASGFPESFTASAESDLPPMEWFENPHLLGPTPLTITEDGRIYGHIVESWNECHISMNGTCSKPPKSKANYAYYTRGGVDTWCASCEKVERVAVGPITASTGHAGLSMSKESTISHYDNSGTVMANVAAGEDKFGIWIAGRIAPGATKEQIDSLLAIGVSGDWRRINGNLELVAVLSVPVPGYPIKRTTQAHAASGVQTALITGFSGHQKYNLIGEEGPSYVIIKDSPEVGKLKKAVISLLKEKINA